MVINLNSLPMVDTSISVALPVIVSLASDVMKGSFLQAFLCHRHEMRRET